MELCRNHAQAVFKDDVSDDTSMENIEWPTSFMTSCTNVITSFHGIPFPVRHSVRREGSPNVIHEENKCYGETFYSIDPECIERTNWCVLLDLCYAVLKNMNFR